VELRRLQGNDNRLRNAKTGKYQAEFKKGTEPST